MNKRVRDFYKGKKALIVTDTKEKGIWKRGLAEYGILAHNIQNVDNLKEAMENVRENAPEIILCENYLPDGSCLELLKLHEQIVPNRINAVFGIIAGKMTMNLQSMLAEREVSFGLVRPITMKSLDDALFKSIELKTQMDPNRIRYYKLFAKFLNDQLAATELNEFVEKDSSWAHFLQAQVHKHANKLDLAIKSLYNVLERDTDHHQALVMFFDINFQKKYYQDAYAAAERIWELYHVNPERVPKYVTVSLATRNFDAIETLCDKLHEMKNEREEFRVPVAAALALAGKYFKGLNGKKDATRKVSHMAMKLCNNKQEIQQQARENLKSIGDDVDEEGPVAMAA